MPGRLDRLRDLLAENELDALLVGTAVEDHFGRHDDNRRYLSGFTGSTGWALVTRNRALFAADFRYTEQAAREVVPRGFEVFEALGNPKEWWPRLWGEAGLAGKKVGVSPNDTSLGAWLALQKRLEGIEDEAARPELVPAPPLIEKLRRHKDSEELTLLQRAIDIADEAFEAMARAIEPGMTERQAAAIFEREVLARGARGVSFETIIAGGPWGAMPHAQPRNEPIPAGLPIVCDLGAQYGGYNSDLTRTIVLGEPDAKFREIYAIVFEAQQAAIDGVRPGMSGVDAHKLAHDVIERAGYEDRFGHGLGHGVGLQVHEAPYLGLSSEDTLEEGMVFTIEPGIYLPGWGGVRIEDIVVLEGGRARVLSRAEKLSPAGV